MVPTKLTVQTESKGRFRKRRGRPSSHKRLAGLGLTGVLLGRVRKGAWCVAGR